MIIAAAGNNGNNFTFYPAACTNVVAVSATDSTASFSWSTRKITRGAPKLQACAHDAATNAGVSTSVTVWK